MPPKEIERKWLVAQMPENLQDFPVAYIKQAYVAIDPAGVIVRIRQKNQTYLLTFKGPGLIERTEIEFAILPSVFNDLWALSNNRMLEKERYYIPFNGFTIELDVFRGKLKGLVMAEIEFPSIEAANILSNTPAWFGKEVTGDYRYTNAFLAGIDGLNGKTTVTVHVPL